MIWRNASTGCAPRERPPVDPEHRHGGLPERLEHGLIAVDAGRARAVDVAIEARVVELERAREVAGFVRVGPMRRAGATHRPRAPQRVVELVEPALARHRAADDRRVVCLRVDDERRHDDAQLVAIFGAQLRDYRHRAMGERLGKLHGGHDRHRRRLRPELRAVVERHAIDGVAIERGSRGRRPVRAPIMLRQLREALLRLDLELAQLAQQRLELVDALLQRLHARVGGRGRRLAQLELELGDAALEDDLAIARATGGDEQRRGHTDAELHADDHKPVTRS